MARRLKRTAADVDAEIDAHLAACIDHLIAGGMTPEDARAEAVRRFGDLESARLLLHTRTRDGFDLRDWVDGLVQDLRYVLRGLRRSPALSTGVIVTLALGLGLTATVFRIADQVLLRPPAGVSGAHDIRAVETDAVFGGGPPRRATQFSYPDARRVIESGAFVSAAMYTPPRQARDGAGRDILTSAADDAYFPLLAVRLVAGRGFDAREATPGTDIAVAIVSDAYWTSALGRAPLDQRPTVTIAARQYDVVGITAPGFVGIDLDPVDVWLPMGAVTLGRGYMNGVEIPWYRSEMLRGLRVLGRLPSGTSPSAIVARLEAAFAGADGGTQHPPRVARLEPIVPVGQGGRNQAPNRLLARLSGVAVLVLLIASANVVNLLLARGLRRYQEIAIRLALGATRARVVRLLVLESVLLATVSGGAAIVAALWTAEALRRLLFPDAQWTAAALDERTLLFTGLLALVAGLAAGVVPALQSTHVSLTAGMGGSRARGSRRARRTRAILVVAQTALSLALLIGSGLLVRSLIELNTVDLGFEPGGLVTASLGGGLGFGDDTPAGHVSAADAAARLASHPAVEQVAQASIVPFGATAVMDIRVPGASGAPDEGRQPSWSAVGPGYFDAVGIRLVRGRLFDTRDIAGEPVALVNEPMASAYWPDGEIPPGACILAPLIGCARVIGVVSGVTDSPAREPDMSFYVPLDGVNRSARALIIRTAGNRTDDAAAAVRAMLPVDQRVAIEVVSERVSRALRPWRTATWLFGALGAVALVLAGIGVYSVMSYTASERTQELGIRVVLGAARKSVTWLIVADGLRWTLAGSLLGMGLAAAAGRTLGALLHGVSPFDPLVYLAAGLVLVLSSLVAMLALARRAAGVDPLKALRGD
jgi:predicted permease